MTDPELFEAFATMQQAWAFSPNTIKRRRLSLSRFARFITPTSVLAATPADVDDWLSKLNSAKTVHAYCSDLRVLLRLVCAAGARHEQPDARRREREGAETVTETCPRRGGRRGVHDRERAGYRWR